MTGDDGAALAESRKQAAEELLRNKECLVAIFFKRYPRADPRHVRLITTVQNGGEVVFRIEYNKEESKGDKAKARRKRRAKKAKAGEGQSKGQRVRARGMQKT